MFQSIKFEVVMRNYKSHQLVFLFIEENKFMTFCDQGTSVIGSVKGAMSLKRKH